MSLFLALDTILRNLDGQTVGHLDVNGCCEPILFASILIGVLNGELALDRSLALLVASSVDR